jgi:arginine utilization protein RocB
MESDRELMWGTPDGLRRLLLELVGHASVSRSSGEATFADRVIERLRDVPQLAADSSAVTSGTAFGRQRFVTALYRAPDTRRTVVLLSHFDTVSTEDFGELEQLACRPEQLEPQMHAAASELDEDARADLAAGGWLWGRGTMDMKMGLALHMSLVERAAAEQWPISLLLLTVPDEEVESAGMRAAAQRLVELRDEHELEYVLFLNGEPGAGPLAPDTRSLFTGSIGKLMPSALAYGRETHAGAPCDGITSSLIASHLTRHVEGAELLLERGHGEVTPVPVSLGVTDIREGYSVKTPYRTAALYNVFVMRNGAGDVLDRFEQLASAAAADASAQHRSLCERNGTQPLPDVRVLRYEELLAHATEKFGTRRVAELLDDAPSDVNADERERAFHSVDVLARACQELTPAIVTLFTAPAYPAVCSTGEPLVESLVERVRVRAREEFGLSIERGHYFPLISDLSYLNFDADAGAWDAYERNTPHFGRSYDIPFAAMAKLRAPVMNLGPLGKDAHKRTERLHERSAFHELPVLAADLVRAVPDLLDATAPVASGHASTS